jgi:hypothetical protein
MSNQLFKLTESFQWLEAIKPLPYPNVIKIVALNAGITGNNNTYLKEELIRSARTMNGKPIYFGTSHTNNKKKEVGIINWAEFESDRVEAVGTVEPDVYQMIQNGEIPHVSIEANFIYPERIDGIAPKGLEFTGLLLLPQGVAPGDPKTSVAIMERIGEILHSISSEEGIKPQQGGETLQTIETQTTGTSASSQDNPSPKIGESGKVQEADKTKTSPSTEYQESNRVLETLGQFRQSLQSFEQKMTSLTERLTALESKGQESELSKPKGKGIVSAPSTREIAGIPIQEVNHEVSEFSDLLRKPKAD